MLHIRFVTQIIFTLLFIPSLLFSDITSCPGNTVNSLDGADADASASISSFIPGNTRHYYSFTPDADGAIQVNGYMNKYSNRLYITKGNCTTTLWSDTGDSSSKSSPTLNITAGEKITVIYQRTYSTSASYTLNFTFTGPDVANANNDTFTTTKNTTLSENILDNDTGPTITVNSIISQPQEGTLSWNPDGSISYAPATDYIGPDSFEYEIIDENGETDQATVSITVAAPLAVSTGGRDFSIREQVNLFGDVRMIGNTVLCQKNASGACIEPTGSNANINLQKVSTSYSTLTLPDNAEIKYARIYWQGRKKASSSGNWNTTSKESASKIKLRKGNSGEYTELVADVLDFDRTGNVDIYSASADALGVVVDDDAYYVDPSSFYTHTGRTQSDYPSDGLGAYGAWVLVVVYKDPASTKARSVTIFDGFKQVTSQDVYIDVNGFLTPKTGTVDSKVYTFTGEGDSSLSGDSIFMRGLNHNTSYTFLEHFNSEISISATRSPDLEDNSGIDIHTYDVGTTGGAKNIITNNETGARFKYTTDDDAYFPSLIVFSTELYLPQMCYDYSIKQDGRYLNVDREAYPIARLDSSISSSDLEVTVYLRNEESDVIAQGISLSSDVNDTRFDLVGNVESSNVNGSTLIDRGTPTSTMPLCAYDKDGDNSLDNNGCTDGHDLRKGLGSLDAQQYIYTKFYLEPKNISGISEIDEPLGLELAYYIVADGKKIDYEGYELGGDNVPLCPPSGAYQPQWGLFNVVPRNLQTNNLVTQIARKPFDVDVIFDGDITTGANDAPSGNIQTTVLVDIADMNSMGDMNASCGNPDSILTSAPLVVPLNLTPSNYQSAIPTQTANFYNFAVENAAMRVWYFVDENDLLIQNWTATTPIDSSLSTSVLSIDGLYKATKHTKCSTECATDTTPACFECIKINYAQPLCSRDNFSIRPESLDVRIYDVDKNLPLYDISTDPTNQKNTTKIELSTTYGFDPNSATSTGKIPVATGYNYRFDITAAGFDSLSVVPGYSRQFSGLADYNAALIWDPSSTLTGCNDTSNRNISFYVGNGMMQNEERMHEEVGEYRLNIFDRTWTAVDWDNLSHHIVSADSGFIAGTDCVVDSTSTILDLNSQHGCLISTQHNGGTSKNYKDHQLNFLPYKFNVDTITPTIGLNNEAITPTSFVYMADISSATDENMSVHINGSIIAQGENNTTLSNFVNGCYAKPLDISLNRTNITLPVAYQYRFKTFDALNTLIRDTNATDLNNSVLPIQTQTMDFNKTLNGTMNTIMNLNYTRSKDNAINPQTITFNRYDVDCAVVADCTFNADLINNQVADGTKDLNTTTIRHYYGRSFTPRQSYTDFAGVAPIFYEAYCNINTGCNPDLLQGTDISKDGDSRWRINPNHTSNYGSAQNITQKNADSVSATTATGNLPDSTNLFYNNSRGRPYTATMQHNPDSWLIYNPYNANATTNEFQAEFIGGASSWAGKTKTTDTTETNASQRTNRRLVW
ncbi:MAG: cadherin-like domain-containing protein [Sulfurimonas sp.]|jgi:hypothetical protein|nr:cadherin-like domain-containing protein [Sulfurimonas sp.]